MKVVITLMILFFISCSSNNNTKTIITSNKTNKYYYELLSFSKKTKNGKSQCNKFKELKVNNSNIYFYGPKLNELLAYLNNTEVDKIKLPNNFNNEYFLLNININNENKDSIFKYIKKDIAKYYKLQEKVLYVKERAFNLYIDKNKILNKYIDTLNLDEGYFEITDNSINIVSLDFNNIVKAINQYFPEINIKSNNKDTSDRFSFKLSNIKSFNDITSLLYNKFGIKTSKIITKNKYYHYIKM